MANGMSTLITGAVAVAGTAGAVTVGAALVRRPRPYLPIGHALAGPRDTDPLPDVLRHGLAGLTVRVRPGPQDELYLGADDPVPGRTLHRLVLTPLLGRAQAGGGRLRRDQSVPFRLVIEFGGPDRDATTLLRAYELLERRLRERSPLLSRCVGGLPEPGAVTVSVAGIVDVRGLLAAQRERYLFVDGSFDDVGDPSAPPELVPMISEPWSRWFGWDGREPFASEERHLLHALVRDAHADGRTVRICEVPSGSRRIRRAVWDELLAAGVDVIGDTDLRMLAGHLRARPVRPEPAPASATGVTARSVTEAA
jgi:hypothetical protein